MAGQKEVGKSDKLDKSDNFDSIFVKKIVKSRNSFLIWVPKDEAEYLDMKDGEFFRVGLKKIKNRKNKND